MKPIDDPLQVISRWGAALIAVTLLAGCTSGGGTNTQPSASLSPAQSLTGTWVSTAPVTVVLVAGCIVCQDPTTFASVCTTSLPLASAQWVFTITLAKGADNNHRQGSLDMSNESNQTMLRDCGIADGGAPARADDFFGGFNLSYQFTGTIGSSTFFGLTNASGQSEGSFSFSATSMTGTFTNFTHQSSGNGWNPVYHTEPGPFTLTLQP